MAVIAGLALALIAAVADPPPGDGASSVDAGRREIEAEPEAAPPGGDLQPPVPIGDVAVPRPAGAPSNAATVLVQVVISVDDLGEVAAVRVEQGAGAPWDAAVLVAATWFRFEPARLDGTPVAVDVPFVVRFLPVEDRPAAEGGPPRDAVLAGHTVEKGTSRPLPGALLTITVGDREYVATSDASGAFRIDLPAGTAGVEIVAPGYKEFHQVETLASEQEVAVRYLVERQRYNPYETIVIGQRDRVEVSRTTLRGRELQRVPGSFGDPFRAVGAMPGIANVFSLFGYAVVRGTSPGDTGFLIDGVPVPQVFHYLLGPAVIHPAFIDRIDFYAGGFPVRYGGYTGGLVDGITTAPRERPQLRVQLDLLKVGALLHTELEDGSKLTFAGRIGYPALLLSLLSADLSASYWDYQARWQSRDGRLSVFLYGSFDEFLTEGNAVADDVTGSDSSGARAMFHRADVQYRTGGVDAFEVWQLTAGYDDVAGGERGTAVRSPLLMPRAMLERRLSPSLRLRAGVDVLYKLNQGEINDVSVADLELASWNLDGGIWSDLPWAITRDLTVTPGMRADLYVLEEAGGGGLVQQLTLDPRVLWRLRILPPERGETFLKGSLGVYSQPPRFPIAVPGLDQVGLTRERCDHLFAVPSDCMLQSTQVSLGLERDLGGGFEVDGQVYYAWMDPIYFDFTLNDPGPAAQSDVDALLQRRQGRSYGLELLLRKRDQGTFFGWIAYTLGRSERLHGVLWKPYDFDRTHVLQVVGGMQLPRNWELGGRLLVQSGRPSSGPYQPLERVDPFWRLDLRIDKRIVYDEMLFDFYVEILNAASVPEGLTADPDGAQPYVFPYFGLEWILPL